MIPVIIESPFAASDSYSAEEAQMYLDECILDCVKRGEAPYASHAIMPRVLSDDNPADRHTGILCGYAFYSRVDLVLFYLDLGMSTGMKQALARCERMGISFRRRWVR